MEDGRRAGRPRLQRRARARGARAPAPRGRRQGRNGRRRARVRLATDGAGAPPRSRSGDDLAARARRRRRASSLARRPRVPARARRHRGRSTCARSGSSGRLRSSRRERTVGGTDRASTRASRIRVISPARSARTTASRPAATGGSCALRLAARTCRFPCSTRNGNRTGGMVDAVLQPGPGRSRAERRRHVRRRTRSFAVVVRLEPHVQPDEARAGARLDDAADPDVAVLDERARQRARRDELDSVAHLRVGEPSRGRFRLRAPGRST